MNSPMHKGRVALVTGAAKGLGRAIVLRLAEHGCDIAIHYRQSQAQAEDLCNVLEARGCKAQIFQGDLSSYSAMQALAAHVLQCFGRVDFLINNVGAYSSKGLFETTADEFSEIIQTNICGTYFLTREILPAMRTKKYGRIINIGDALAQRLRAFKTETPYHISKTGVLMLTKSIAQIEGAHGITCNMVSPGVMVNSEAMPSDLEKSIPLGRPAEFSEILGAIDYLLSPAADYVTGADIDVAGGYGL